MGGGAGKSDPALCQGLCETNGRQATDGRDVRQTDGYVKENGRQEGGALSPDWTFFGRTATGNPYREMPLLSVRADDGQTFMGE